MRHNLIFDSMNSKTILFMLIILFAFISIPSVNAQKTFVKINGDAFYINGKPTYAGRYWEGNKIEGLLFNSRMVQGIFDDSNPETIHNWIYPDTKKWDPERNTREFIKYMKTWRKYGLLSFTINIQGGSPFGYSKAQPWDNAGYKEDGSLDPAYIKRLEKILDRADKLGMVPILGLFYFGQDQRLKDEKAVINAVDNVIDWLHSKKYRNVLIEVNNESNNAYDHKILKSEYVHELMERIRKNERNGHRYYVSTSFNGNVIPYPNVVKSADFLLLHGNGVKNSDRIREMVELSRKVEGYRTMPILFNEDDHFDFDKPGNYMVTATKAYASWGYFDYRMKEEGFEQGYQSVPVDWGINSDRKRGFFNKLKEITGSK